MSVPLSAAEQLSVSRARLRQALCENLPATGAANQRLNASPTAFLESLKSVAGANILFDALVQWWKMHPLRSVALLAADATKSALQPVAQRHPVSLMLGSFLAGGALAWSRPWRLIVTPALVAGLLPQALSAVAAVVVGMPSRSWIEVLTSLAQQYIASSAPAARRGDLSKSAHEQ